MMYDANFGTCKIINYRFEKPNIKNLNKQSSARFFLTDENDNIINLNGVNFSFVLHMFKKA